ncbi:ABC transporter permease [Halomicrococcus gelatinilyticus]|uniref:ABC transporter permease n=1 Tax=Halomicrococcus gelatinilyticus TaxID=1702103 RepID=UPI002E13D5F1
MSTDTRSGATPSDAVGRASALGTVRSLRGVAGTAGFVAAWWVAALFQPPYLLPSPVEVAAAFAAELAASAVYTVPLVGADVELSRLVVKLLQSLQHYVPGLVAGTVLGVGLGVAMGWNDRLDDALTPVTRVLRPIPPLAWIAFAIVWIGIGHAGAAFIVGIGAFWINFYNAYSGVGGVPADLKEVAASLGVDDDREMIRRVVLPSATPEIATGVRTSIGQCWMIVVAAELFGAPGVGYQIIVAAQNLEMAVSVAYMLVISAVFLVSDGLFRRVEGRVLAWRT